MGMSPPATVSPTFPGINSAPSAQPLIRPSAQPPAQPSGNKPRPMENMLGSNMLNPIGRNGGLTSENGTLGVQDIGSTGFGNAPNTPKSE